MMTVSKPPIQYYDPHADNSPTRLREARHLLSKQPKAQYEATKPTRLRKSRQVSQSQNQLVSLSGKKLRNHVRFLERNHDIARGAIRTLVNNIVGEKGIGIEPQPRVKGSNEIHQEYADALRNLWLDFCRKPEVTWAYRWASVQRMMARTWIRDGEAFAQMVVGNMPNLVHGTIVPFSLEMIDPDMLPLDFDDESRNINQGVQRNQWGRVNNFYFHKKNPLEAYSLTVSNNLKRVSADRVLHIASRDRIGQLRGVSEFASVITRLEDIKDYEESERVAAKVAAMLTAYVKRGTPEFYDKDSAETDDEGNPVPRDLKLSPGMIFDSLAVGEDIGLIDSNRPNPNIVTFRGGQLRAAVAGIGASYSSVSRDYSGTYSSQRQELVEQYVHYATLADEFVGQFIQPTWENFVSVCHLSGVLPIPTDVDLASADDALFVGQSMPWIDPMKEATAWVALVQAGFASEVEVMRKRGVNPRDVLEQIGSWRALTEEKGLKFSSDINAQQTKPETKEEPDKDDGVDGVNTGDEVEASMMASLVGVVGAMAQKEPAAPVVNITQGDVTVNTPETKVDVAAPSVNVEPAAVNVENQVNPTPVDVSVENVIPDIKQGELNLTVKAEMPEEQKVVITGMPDRDVKTTVLRDENGEMIGSQASEKDKD